MPDQLPARPPLDVRALADVAPGVVVEVLPTATSTNAVLAERARAGAPEGLVVVAEHQTAGRGRLDRTWQAPERAALVFSLLLRPQRPAQDWPWLPLLTGYAAGRVLRERGHAVGLKWPNDLLVGDRKVAGILVERVESPQGPAAVLGIGLNVSTTAAELPVPTATSLALESGDPSPDRTALLVALVRGLVEEHRAWERDGTGPLRAAYTRECVTLGRRVRVELPAAEGLVGTATGVDAGGRLMVSGPSGEVAVGAGDVVHVRPADGPEQ